MRGLAGRQQRGRRQVVDEHADQRGRGAVPQAFRCASIVAGPSHAAPERSQGHGQPEESDQHRQAQELRARRSVAVPDADAARPGSPGDRRSRGPDAHRGDGHGRRTQRDDEDGDRGDGKQAEAERRALGSPIGAIVVRRER